MTASTAPTNDKNFAGSIPKIYEQLLVPMIFEPYAADIVRRLQARKPSRILEVAAGTGVVTRAMARALPAGSTIVATDLNQAMLDQGQAIGTSRPVEWRQADAQQLPFADGSFDAVVIQFGVMFFPDRPKALGEARRVLRKGGLLVFNVWDGLRDNEFADAVHQAVAKVFPANPPGFLARTPYGYNDPAAIARDIAAAGFSAAPRIDTVPARSPAPSAREPAVAYCEGTPLRGEIEARGAPGLEATTRAATEAIEQRFGRGALEAKIQALVVEADA